MHQDNDICCDTATVDQTAADMDEEGSLDQATRNQQGRTTEQGMYVITANLAFDPKACVLQRRGKHVSLTARECALLSRLLRTPRCYVSADVLSQQLSSSRPGDYFLDKHSIEQTICDRR